MTADLRDRFEAGLDEQMRAFSGCADADARLLDEEVDASAAHVRMLRECELLPSAAAEALLEGLERVRREFAAEPALIARCGEDIHMAVETRLEQLVGEAAGRLHTARSRNDLIATDVRLWLKRALARLDGELAELLRALLDRIERDGRTLVPGYTHLQRGQPIWLGHHLLAHAWALQRDRGRLADALARLDECPLGACALAGTGLPIDRARTARLLGFARPVANAMDAVSARDHLQEVAAACAICMSNLSRMAAELVLWSSTEFDLVRLHDRHATGSSIMPQKRNPDAAELVRGKAARVFGDLAALLVVAKGLPLAYNRDLQEDRPALFDAVDTTRACVRMLAVVWEQLQIRRDRFVRELSGDYSLATELADAAVLEGLPFRAAHAAVARLVATLERDGRALHEATDAELAAVHPRLPARRHELLDPVAAVERRTSLGGSAWSQVRAQVSALRGHLPGDAGSEGD